MVNTLDTSLNAIQNNFARLQTSADNIANLNTDGYKGQRLIFSQGASGNPTPRRTSDLSPGPTRLEENQQGDLVEIEMSNVDLATEMVKSMESEQAIKANIKAARTADEILGEIIDTLA
ncbi:MAG: hypothetical protein JXR80_07840 [Deltaproteobacteria bacterium]|nr:hypothetical protein [Deltaproteobacteria bacterium]